MKRTYFSSLGAFVGFAVLLYSPFPALAQATDPTLGLTALRQFGVLSGAAVTGSTGLGTAVNGDVGSGNSSITNFVGSTIPGPSRTVAPFIVHYAVDATVTQALLDARTAWVNMGNQGLLPTAIPLGPQLSGQVLTSGIYNFAAAADLASPGGVVTGTLTLNGPGIFIFNVGSSLTTNVNSMVVGTADPCNVFWRMGGGGSATLNGNSFYGTVIADQAVTVASQNPAGTVNTVLTGRAVGIIAAVTMPGAGGNTIGGCSAPVVVCPAITLSPATLAAGSVGVPYAQTISASPAGVYTFTVSSGALPNGLTLNPATGTITGVPTTLGLFNFTILATDAAACTGSRAYSIAIGALAPAGGATLDPVGLTILMVLLAAAGLFVMNKFSI